ncbi:MAG: hypothetical protein R2799_03650 [Crocinitomicaceae bacterium]
MSILRSSLGFHMFILQLVILQTSFSNTFSQTIQTQNKINDVEYLYENKEYNEAQEILSKLIHKKKVLNFKGIQLYLLLNQKLGLEAKSTEYLEHLKHVEKHKYNQTIDWLAHKNSDLALKFEKIEFPFDSLKYNLSLHIDSLSALDQIARKSSTIDSTKSLIKADSIIFENLFQLYKSNLEYFHTYYTVDNDFYHLILHMIPSRVKKLKPLLKRLLHSGRIEPFYYSSIMDRTQNNLGKRTKCFSYVIGVEKKKPISLAKIRRHRRAIGLSPYYLVSYSGFLPPINKMGKIDLKEYHRNYFNQTK